MRDSELQQKRLVAAAIDIGIAIALAVVMGVLLTGVRMVFGLASTGSSLGAAIQSFLGFLGTLVGLGYLLGRDLLGDGRSLGKKAVGIRLVTTSGGPIAVVHSAKRNGIFAIGWALGLVSAFLSLALQFFQCLRALVGCLLAPLVILGVIASVVAAVVEIIRITQDPDGIRYGDQYAGTRVVR